jgi:2-amino-4-hydroxy-6-hydroxymethyldihydropteridine diphosphokinase
VSAAARVYVGLGSNLERPIGKVQAGMAALRELPDSHVVRCSSLYRSAPVGLTEQPDFINAVCMLETVLTPQVLMRRLLSIESVHGRRRGQARGGPRTLDLDLLLYDDLTLTSDDVTVPHARLHERAFVLYPLFEIAPALHVPGFGPIAELLDRCKGQAIERLAGSDVRQGS